MSLVDIGLAALLVFSFFAVVRYRQHSKLIRVEDAKPLPLKKWLTEHHLSLVLVNRGDYILALFRCWNGGDALIVLIDERGETEVPLDGRGVTVFEAVSKLIERYHSIEEPEYVRAGWMRVTRRIAPLTAEDLS